MIAVLLASALMIGGLLAVQASANLQLTKAVGTPYGAATLQLWVAAALLGTLAVATGTFVALTRLADVPSWYLLGGLASPLYITSGILLFPRIGALAAGGLFVTGQMLASIALDGFGLFGIARQTLDAGTLVGSVAVLAGITAIVRGQSVKIPAVVGLGRPADPATPPPPAPAGVTPGWLLLGLLAGAVLPIQGAVNARLRTVVVEPIAVALVSFVVAALTITIVFAVLRTADRTPTPQLARLGGMPWWGWLGGVCAVGYVTGTFMLLPQIGAAVTVALTVTGQQLASALIDTRGLFRLPSAGLHRGPRCRVAPPRGRVFAHPAVLRISGAAWPSHRPREAPGRQAALQALDRQPPIQERCPAVGPRPAQQARHPRRYQAITPVRTKRGGRGDAHRQPPRGPARTQRTGHDRPMPCWRFCIHDRRSLVQA